MVNKGIILTADDYGAMDFIDKAIIESIKLGAINCVTCFVCFPTSQQRILQLKELQKDYDFAIGLHFSITAGNPVIYEKNSLCENINGSLHFLEARHYPFNSILHTEIEAELKAQVNLLAGWLGGMHKVDHISNHHGVVYVDEQFFSVYSHVASLLNIPIRSPLVWSQSDLSYLNQRFRLLNPLTRYGVYYLQWLGERREARQFDLKMEEAADKKLAFPFCNNDCIYGLGNKNNLEHMLNNYTRYNMTTEFMFHLGYYKNHKDECIGEETPHGIDPGYFNDRKDEYELLSHFNLPDHLHQLGIEKTFFRKLSHGAHQRQPL